MLYVLAEPNCPLDSHSAAGFARTRTGPMSKTMSEIERIRMNRERRREEMHAAKMERDAQKRADDAEVHRAAMLLNRRIRTNKNAENNAPSGSVVGKQARYGPEFKRMIASFRSSLDLSVTHCEEDTVSNCTTQNTNHSMGRDSRLSVYVRKRPLTAEEVHARYFDVVTVLGDMSLALHEPKTKVDMSRTLDNHVFSFDGVFDESASSEDVFEVGRCLAPCVDAGDRPSGFPCRPLQSIDYKL